jgi:glycine betaine transporter
MTPPAVPRHILVPHDFSDTAQGALAYAIALAKKLGARLTIVHAFEVPAYGYAEGIALTAEIIEGIQRSCEEGLRSVADKASQSGLQVEAVLRQGPAWSEVDRVAREMAVDLVVMGTHGRTGLSRALLGSVAEKVLRTAPCPVLTVRSLETR